MCNRIPMYHRKFRIQSDLRRFKFVGVKLMIMASACCFLGCSSLGHKTIPVDQFNFNTAINEASSEQLLLKKETIDVVAITERLVRKYILLANHKELLFSSNLKPIYCQVDVFHFENVISNLIDNAVKYGGNQIDININSILKSTEITIADDGPGIEKNQQEKIFDKFYRVPRGNTHDVKGFGIGLYYCKKIIEKHMGTIGLSSDKKQTIFKITIPNE